MKSILPVVFFLFFLNSVKAESVYSKGYFITNDGDRVACLIKTVGFSEFLPKEISYRKENNYSDLEIISTDDIAELEVAGYKYKRFILELKKSKFGSEMVKRSVLLRILTEGNISLLLFNNGVIKEFYLNPSDGRLIQIKNQNIISITGSKEESFSPEDQLQQILLCDGLDAGVYENIDYTIESLMHLMTEYYNCKEEPYTIISEKSIPFYKRIHMYLKPGIDISTYDDRKFQIKNSSTFGLIAEFEYHSKNPVNPGAFTLGISYRTFDGIHEYNNISRDNITFSNTSVTACAIYRKYIYLNNSFKAFFGGGMGYGRSNNTNEIGVNYYQDETKFSATEITAGLGLIFKDRLTFDTRFYWFRNTSLERKNYFDISGLSLTLGYKVF